MDFLKLIALIPAALFIVGGLLIVAVFDVAKYKYDRDDTISRQVYRWSLAFSLLRYIFAFAAGFLTCHFFGV